MKAVSFIILFVMFPAVCIAEEFTILKVNRTKKMYVVPPDRRSFMGSRGIEKFDYERLLPEELRGEFYTVTWRRSGSGKAMPVRLRFEYRCTADPAVPYTENVSYTDIKRGTYKWVFKNTGADFTKRGALLRWKVSLLQGDTVKAQKRSFTWKAMEGT